MTGTCIVSSCGRFCYEHLRTSFHVSCNPFILSAFHFEIIVVSCVVGEKNRETQNVLHVVSIHGILSHDDCTTAQLRNRPWYDPSTSDFTSFICAHMCVCVFNSTQGTTTPVKVQTSSISRMPLVATATSLCALSLIPGSRKSILHLYKLLTSRMLFKWVRVTCDLCRDFSSCGIIPLRSIQVFARTKFVPFYC